MEKMTPEQWVTWCREHNTDVHYLNKDTDGERNKRRLFIQKFEECVDVPHGKAGNEILRRAGYEPLPEIEDMAWVQTEFGLPYNVRRRRHLAFNGEKNNCRYLMAQINLPEDAYVRAFERSPVIRHFCELIGNDSVVRRFEELDIDGKEELGGLFGIKRSRLLSICNFISQTKMDQLVWHKHPQADHIDGYLLHDTKDNCVFDPNHARKSRRKKNETPESIQAEIDKIQKKLQRMQQ